MFAFIDSPLQILVVIVVLLIVFGPQKLPEMLGQLGRAIREFKRTTTDLAGSFNMEQHQYESSYNPPRYDSYGNRVDELNGATVPEEDVRTLSASETTPSTHSVEPEPPHGDFAASALADPAAHYGADDAATRMGAPTVYGVMPDNAPKSNDVKTEVKTNEVDIRPAEGAVPRRP